MTTSNCPSNPKCNNPTNPSIRVHFTKLYILTFCNHYTINTQIVFYDVMDLGESKLSKFIPIEHQYNILWHYFTPKSLQQPTSLHKNNTSAQSFIL